MEYPSKLIEAAMEQFATLPGIGRKTALRLALHLLKQNKEDVQAFGSAFINMRENVRFCKECFNVSDHEVCQVCSSHKRDRGTLCVVEDMRDVMAIENTQQYRGLYHVLGGIISPMDGIGPSDLNIEPLINRAQRTEVSEVILALSSTMEGDTTSFYLFKKLSDLPINISTIARGVPVGDELEYADEITLGRSIANRMPYEGALSVK